MPLPLALALAMTAAVPMDHAAQCPQQAEPLPAGLAGWSAPRPISAAASAGAAARAVLEAGTAVDATLLPTPTVHYAKRPEKPGGLVSFGGLFAFTAPEGGTYRVAIGSAAWIEVLAAGRAIESAAHAPGPRCSGVRKMVDFRLAPGRYLLQIAGNGQPRLAILVARLP